MTLSQLIGGTRFVRRAGLTAAAIGFLVFAGAASAQGPTAISIVDRSFQPADLTVNVGDTVTWTVTKAIADPHSVTSGAPGNDSGKVFDSGIKLRNNGDAFSWTFSTAGSFAYYCTVHPAEMHGTILVLAPGQTAPPAATAAPVQSPAEGEHPPISTTDKLVAAGIIGLTLLVLFGAATFYRRVNP